MKLELIKPGKALNKAYLKEKVSRSHIELFKKNLLQLHNRINEQESEEHLKNVIADFLKDTWYKEQFEINTKDRNDLVIHIGKNTKEPVGVILEVKKPSNKTEMMTEAKPNSKALQELVLYYLRERVDCANTDIKFLIITNIYEWFIIDEVWFEKNIFRNNKLKKDYENWKLSGKDTKFFYESIAKSFLDEVTEEMPAAFFDIRTYEEYIHNTNREDDTKLIGLYKILSPAHLLKQPFTNDSNSLDTKFYTELLHIIGLEETKNGSKKLIKRKLKPDEASLLEDTIIKLEDKDALRNVPNLSTFGATGEEQLFNAALELCITWVNRVLFIKLLEAQLFKYRKGDKDYLFLNSKVIFDFDELSNLFFQVLAEKPESRRSHIREKFSKVPYLNSSLFDRIELERVTINVSELDNRLQLPLSPATVLKDEQGKRKTGSLPVLQYLFEFLDAYDFSSDGGEEIQEENKNLINASVLGLIFEKINGYKDGSFFTPGFVTMYMCKETIRRAVLQKFNDTKGWNCDAIKSLYNKIDDKKEANQIINSLHICDPAAGSGHFLVSALNEIIAIKSELKILQDAAGKSLRDYHAEVVNDELIITDEDGKLFDYNPNNKESQRVQETLFHEKETIIENCLFGVDINPNSVKICRLRLWIELLKHTYYKETEMGENASPVCYANLPGLRPEFKIEKQLETLPNIDINIKCGNSLISRFALDADIKDALRNSKWSIDSYKAAVQTYREAESKEQKREMEELIDSIKKDFRSYISPNDPKYKKLSKLRGDLFNLSQTKELFDDGNKKSKDAKKKMEQLSNNITKLEKEIEEIKNNKIYENAFEWRFEFPEVLNDDGDFIGFDVVIGNPPYGVNLSDNEKEYLKNRFTPTSGEVEIYTFFIELAMLNLLNKNGYFSYITTNTIYYLDKFSLIRKKVFLENKIISLTELEKQVFADAPDIVPAIYVLQKNNIVPNMIKLYKSKETKRVYDLIDFEGFNINQIEQTKFETKKNYAFGLSTNEAKENLLTKISLLDPVEKAYKVVYGIKTGDNQKFISKEISGNLNWKKCTSSAKNIKKYIIDWQGDYLNVCDDLAGLNNINYEQPKILIQYIRKLSMPVRLVCALDTTGEYYPLNNFSFIIAEEGNSLKVLLALLNSNLMNWYFSNCFVDYNIKPKYIEQLPLPKVINSSELETAIDKIILIKSKDLGADTIKIEDEINNLVYKLYDLTEDEIKLIEQS